MALARKGGLFVVNTLSAAPLGARADAFGELVRGDGGFYIYFSKKKRAPGAGVATQRGWALGGSPIRSVFLKEYAMSGHYGVFYLQSLKVSIFRFLKYSVSKVDRF